MGNKLPISEERASQRALLDYRIDNGTLLRQEVLWLSKMEN